MANKNKNLKICGLTFKHNETSYDTFPNRKVYNSWSHVIKGMTDIITLDKETERDYYMQYRISCSGGSHSGWHTIAAVNGKTAQKAFQALKLELINYTLRIVSISKNL